MPETPAPLSLAPRERQCLRLLAQGHRIDAIAARLGIAKKTVDNHLASAREKLGAANSEQAIVIAIQHGLLSEENDPMHRANAQPGS